jgi:hypothetical protein
MVYRLPVIPQNLETFKEGLFGALFIGALPFVLFWVLNKVFPVMEPERSPADGPYRIGKVVMEKKEHF